MPTRPATPCAQPGCPALAVRGGRCVQHQRERMYARPSPSAMGYDRNWQRIRARFLRQYPFCAMCGAEATDVDHVVPLRSGGTHDESNLQALCHACHGRKTATHDNTWGRAG